MDATWWTEAPPGTPLQSCGRCPRHLGVPRAYDQIGTRDNLRLAIQAVDVADTSTSRRRRRQQAGSSKPLLETLNAERIRRAQLGLCCKRIFRKPGEPWQVGWERPQALGVQDPKQAEEIQGWIAPDLHYPGDADPLLAPKAAPPTRASSSAVARVRAKDSPRGRQTADRAPTDAHGRQTADEYPVGQAWELLRLLSRSPRRRRNA